MRAYPEYKASGVEWLGDIPSDWSIWKVSRLFKKIGSGTTPKAGTPEYYENGIIPWINTGDLNDGYINDCSNYITQKAFDDHSTLKLYEAETILVAMYGATIGKISITKFRACTNQACCALSHSKKIDTKFAFYWFIANKENIINLSYGGGQPNISQDVVRELKIPICDINEQHDIVNFLDYKTRLIDNFIANRQQQQKLLKEQKAGIINKAVTKGINPHANMKTSGIEWIGDIPENWQVMKLKYVLKICNGDGLLSEFIKDEEEFEVIGGNGVLGYANKFNVDGITIVIGRVGAKCGNVHYFNRKIYVNDNAMIVKPFKNIMPEYLTLLLETMNLNNLSTSTAQPLLTSTAIKNKFICLSTTDIQNEIIDYIKTETALIDTLITKYQKQIELMQEYRTALISQAVTGKIDVRHWQPKTGIQT